MKTQSWSSCDPIRSGLLVITLGIGGVIGWAFLAKVNGAVVAAGIVEVEGNGQKVQHAEGGTVKEIRVKDGDLVEIGQTVVVLDSTELIEELDATQRQLFETQLSMDRYKSMAEHSEALLVRSSLHSMAGADNVLRRRLEEERQLYGIWRDKHLSKRAQFAKRISSLEAILASLFEQEDALVEAINHTDMRLDERHHLLKMGLERTTALVPLEREKFALKAQIAALRANLAETEGALTQAASEERELDYNIKELALVELRKAIEQEAALLSRRRVIEDRIQRQTLRAPAKGIVHELNVFTEGGVIGAGNYLMTIVPTGRSYKFIVRVVPTDIENVSLGQLCRVKLLGIPPEILQDVEATVQDISPDISTDPITGQNFYRVNLRINEISEASLASIPLLPGMPIEVKIQTRARTVAGVLMSPISDFFRLALIET